MAEFQDLVAEIIEDIKADVEILNNIMKTIEEATPSTYPTINNPFEGDLIKYNEKMEDTMGRIREKIDSFKQMPTPPEPGQEALPLSHHSLRVGFHFVFRDESHEIVGLEITGLVADTPIGDPTVYSSSLSSSSLP